MKTQKLILEMPDSLLEQLEYLAEATDQSLESLAINCLNHCLPQVAEDVQALNKILEKITPENIHVGS